MKKGRGAAAFLLAVLFYTVPAHAGESLIASEYSDRFHRPSCVLAAKIYEDEKIVFASRADADAAGYVPCLKCHPEAASRNFGSR